MLMFYPHSTAVQVLGSKTGFNMWRHHSGYNIIEQANLAIKTFASVDGSHIPKALLA